MKEKIDKELFEFVKECRNSCFAMHNYSVSVMFDHFVSSMLLHTWYDEMDTRMENKSKQERTLDKKYNQAWLERIIPEFQRPNNKWNNNMKTKFIENILKGAKTELLFFRFKDMEDAKVIDGLQRTTAIIDFFNGKIKPFGKSINELIDCLNMFHTCVTVKIYTFDDWEKVGRFYVDMNENITHSKADIQKAKDWFLKEKGIVL